MSMEKISNIFSWPTKILAIERMALIFIMAIPIFYLAIPHWITNISIMATIFCVISLSKKNDFLKTFQSDEMKSVLLFFFIYTLAIIFSQIGRTSFLSRPYVDQSRWMIGLPIFLFLYYKKIDYAKVLDWTLPVCIFTAWISSVFIIPSNDWGDRATVSFMDPLAFGFMNLSIGLMCLASVLVDFYYKKITLNTFIKLLAFIMGLYLSIRSGSRTGWIGVPIGLFFILGFIFKKNLKNYFISIGGILIAVFFVYFLSVNVHGRINQAVFEIIDYPWFGGVAPDTSVGLRITFYRLGTYYVSQSPFFGWGERGYGVIKDAPELLLFSSQYARDFAYSALFHSEWTTQAVRYGLIGVFAVFWVLWVPVKFFYKFQKRRGELLKVSCMGSIYMVSLLAGSFTNEVFNSKGTISFTTVIVAGLLASGLSFKKKPD